MKLLDLYSGCGGMSTGLCQGGILSGSDIITVSSSLFSILKNQFNSFYIDFCFDIMFCFVFQ